MTDNGTRRLGAHEVPISPIGLGLAALGRPAYINIGHAADLPDISVPAMEAHAHAVLDAAWRQGIRYFDAARSYGRAEEFLASWLRSRGIATSDATVGSKWGYVYTAEWRVDAEEHEVKEHSLGVLRRQWSESDEHLGAWLRLYQIHSATPDTGVLEDQPVLDELARLKEQGVMIGLSVSGPDQGETIVRALEVAVEGLPLFGAVQATWNLLERSAERALALASSAGVGVIIKEALANGRLTERNQEAEFAPRLELLRHEADRLGGSIDALALAAALGQEWADVVLSGATTVAQLESNLQAHAIRWDDEAADRLAPLAVPAGEYWGRRKELPWN